MHDIEIDRSSLRDLAATINTRTGCREPKPFGYNPAADWQEAPWAMHFISLPRKWSILIFLAWVMCSSFGWIFKFISVNSMLVMSLTLFYGVQKNCKVSLPIGGLVV